MVCLIIDENKFDMSLAELGSIIEAIYTTFPANSPQVYMAQKMVDAVYEAFDDEALFDMWCDEFNI